MTACKASWAARDSSLAHLDILLTGGVVFWLAALFGGTPQWALTSGGGTGSGGGGVMAFGSGCGGSAAGGSPAPAFCFGAGAPAGAPSSSGANPFAFGNPAPLDNSEMET